MRAALVGCGQVSGVHIIALQAIEGLESAAVCDWDEWRARETASTAGGANAYSDLATLLEEERPDAVHVLTLPETHAELAIQPMEAGCHALVEKPIALSLPQADSMIAAARENGARLCTDDRKLFEPSIVKARRLIASGAVGQVVYIDTFYGVSDRRKPRMDERGCRALRLQPIQGDRQ